MDGYVNDILEEIRQENIQANIDALIAEIEYEEDLMYLSDPRAFGPDADDSQGLFYWDLK